MNLLKLLPIVAVFFLTDCKKKDPDIVDANELKEIPVITGIAQRDINAQPIGDLGIPNTKTGTLTDYNRVLAYPNPCTSGLKVVINTGDTTTAHIWLVKGDYQEGNTNAEEYTWGEGNFIPIDMRQFLDVGATTIQLDVANVPNGYYRLYTEFNSVKLWDNIWVNR